MLGVESRRLPLRRPGVWLRQAGHENAIVDPTTGAVHMLNDTALAIWHLCDGGTSPDEMVQAICDVSRLHQEVVEEDVTRILGEFDAAGILAWADA